MTELLTEASPLDPIDMYLPPVPPNNLLESTSGGLRQAIETRPANGETSQQFLRRLYGASYEYRDECDGLRAVYTRLAEMRGEKVYDGLTYIEPSLRVSLTGEMDFDYDSMAALMSADVPEFGGSALLHGEWLVLGAQPRLVADGVGEADGQGFRKVMVQVTPVATAEQVQLRDVVFVANPLRYVLTPDEIHTIRAFRET